MTQKLPLGLKKDDKALLYRIELPSGTTLLCDGFVAIKEEWTNAAWSKHAEGNRLNQNGITFLTHIWSLFDQPQLHVPFTIIPNPDQNYRDIQLLRPAFDSQPSVIVYLPIQTVELLTGAGLSPVGYVVYTEHAPFLSWITAHHELVALTQYSSDTLTS